MDLPTTDNLAVTENIVVSMLRGRQARMVGKYSKPIADFNVAEQFGVAGVDLAMLL